ncbi:transposase [Enterococcus sp. DIV0187]|uniref:transposase n=1 Tax=Enterococcus sp. DIV0187 TaxID=2774644 RepID=UPI003F26238F
MSIIQQPTLFDTYVLEQLDIEEKHQKIFSPLELLPLVQLFQKETKVGPPITVNYEAAIRALLVSYLEEISTITALVSRIKQDLRFKLSLGFLYDDVPPSESTFSRIIHTFEENGHLLKEQNRVLLKQINQEFDIFSEAVSFDATAVMGHTKPTQNVKAQVASCEEQRVMTTEELNAQFPLAPQWGIKANSQGKNNYWFGYKAHLAVASESQYILSAILTSANIADMSVGIPMLRDLKELGIRNTSVIFDKGYDAKAIYKEAHHLNFEPIIPLKRIAKNDGEWTDNYAPTCLLEHGYRYDSFDPRYDVLKFTQPLDKCHDCSLFHAGLCQKVIKIKQQHDPRKFNHPARGAKAWEKLYAKRSAVERVNGYLEGTHEIE